MSGHGTSASPHHSPASHKPSADNHQLCPTNSSTTALTAKSSDPAEQCSAPGRCRLLELGPRASARVARGVAVSMSRSTRSASTEPTSILFWPRCHGTTPNLRRHPTSDTDMKRTRLRPAQTGSDGPHGRWLGLDAECCSAGIDDLPDEVLRGDGGVALSQPHSGVSGQVGAAAFGRSTCRVSRWIRAPLPVRHQFGVPDVPAEPVPAG